MATASPAVSSKSAAIPFCLTKAPSTPLSSDCSNADGSPRNGAPRPTTVKLSFIRLPSEAANNSRKTQRIGKDCRASSDACWLYKKGAAKTNGMAAAILLSLPSFVPRVANGSRTRCGNVGAHGIRNGGEPSTRHAARRSAPPGPRPLWRPAAIQGTAPGSPRVAFPRIATPGLSVCAAHAQEVARFYHDSSYDARARHWREHDDLYRCERHSLASFASQGHCSSRGTRHRGHQDSRHHGKHHEARYVLCKLPRLCEAGPGFLAAIMHRRPAPANLEQWRGSQADSRRDGQRELFRHAGDPSGHGALLFAG